MINVMDQKDYKVKYFELYYEVNKLLTDNNNKVKPLKPNELLFKFKKIIGEI